MSGEERGNMSVSGGGDHCRGGGGKSGVGGIIIAGWGTSHPCHHLDPVTRGSDSRPLVPETEIDNFRMSFTKRLVSGSGSGARRKPVLVSRARSDPWRPAGSGEQRNHHKGEQGNHHKGEQGAWCSVCLDPGQGAEARELRRELEREVKLLQSRPSLAYKKHSPRNWSQDNLLGKRTLH